MNRTEKYIKNTIWGMLYRLISIIMPFACRTALIYSLGIEYVGLNTLFSAVLQVLNLTELGIGAAIVFCMYEPIANNDKPAICALLKLYRTIYARVGLIIVALGVAIVPVLPRLTKGSYPEGVNIYIIYVLYLANTVSGYFLFAHKASMMYAFQRADVKNKILLVVNTSMYVVQIIILLLIRNYYAFIAMLPLSTIVFNLIIQRISKSEYPTIICEGEVSKEKKQVIKEQVINLFWHKIGNTIIFSFDSIVISYVLGLRDLGLYNNYYYIFISVASLFSIFYDSIIPGIGNSSVLETKEKNYKDFCSFSSINMIFSTICTCCLLCLYQPFMVIWQGPDLMCENMVPILMSILFFVWHSRRMIHTYKDASGLWKIDRYRPICEATFNLVLNLSLVGILGLRGIVVSTIMSMLLIGIPWEVHAFIKDHFGKKVSSYYSHVIICVCKAVVVCGVSSILCCYIPDRGVPFFILKALLCILISALLTILLYRKNQGWIDLKDAIIKYVENQN